MAGCRYQYTSGFLCGTKTLDNRQFCEFHDKDTRIENCLKRIAELETKIREYENATAWNTNCLNCAKLFDSSIAETERAEKAEQDAAELANKLSEASLSVADWAQYASEYFIEKHGLEDELKEYGKVLSEHGAKYLRENS